MKVFVCLDEMILNLDINRDHWPTSIPMPRP
jgi:hypothetical protein